MADPKYANLPGIDMESPDVYETSSLPEDDQAQASVEDLDSESVEHLNVSPSEAYTKFRGKPLDAKGIDFSDKVSKDRRTGYDIPRTEYEMVGEGPMVTETPQQKYQRLQHEIRLLAEEVNQVKDSVKAESVNETMSPVVMARQVEYLQQQLTDLHLDKLLGTPGAINLADPQGALQKRLLTELVGFQEVKGSPGKAGQTETAPGSGDADHVTYQLFYRPEQAKFSNNARMADVEQRLERLEALLGNNPEKVSFLTADTGNKSLLGAVALLNAKTKLLEPGQLDLIEGRLHALGQKLNQITEKKDSIEQSDKQTKVTELFELVKKWDSLSDTLPHIVDRLTALKDLHEQALQFSQALAHLDTAQQQISTHLEAHGDMLKQVQSSLADNMSSVKTNFEGLDSRLKSLQK